MTSRPVMFSLKLTDCLQNDRTDLSEMQGRIEVDPLVYRYIESGQDATVTLEIFPDVIRLIRQADALTTIVFRKHELGDFSIQDTQGSFSGSVRTLAWQQASGYVYLYYRLYANDDLITEQILELNAKEIDA